MGMVSVLIGSLVTGLNPSAAIHLLDGMFPSRWVPENLVLFSELHTAELTSPAPSLLLCLSFWLPNTVASSPSPVVADEFASFLEQWTNSQSPIKLFSFILANASPETRKWPLSMFELVPTIFLNSNYLLLLISSSNELTTMSLAALDHFEVNTDENIFDCSNMWLPASLLITTSTEVNLPGNNLLLKKDYVLVDFSSLVLAVL
ncbi:hypothetical protein DSO57_1015572 [Entomophthora muscae]|uniref:Uncharacterized protein n=1 Tax=Entomophthora muscae TaxID=34485 RepID=A0ACC2RWE1_9FUNG|nr:hypothetical protein DSO57_1015572 [Entomophthora muscae]